MKYGCSWNSVQGNVDIGHASSSTFSSHVSFKLMFFSLLRTFVLSPVSPHSKLVPLGKRIPLHPCHEDHCCEEIVSSPLMRVMDTAVWLTGCPMPMVQDQRPAFPHLCLLLLQLQLQHFIFILFFLQSILLDNKLPFKSLNSVCAQKLDSLIEKVAVTSHVYLRISKPSVWSAKEVVAVWSAKEAAEAKEVVTQINRSSFIFTPISGPRHWLCEWPNPLLYPGADIIRSKSRVAGIPKGSRGRKAWCNLICVAYVGFLRAQSEMCDSHSVDVSQTILCKTWCGQAVSSQHRQRKQSGDDNITNSKMP